MDLCKLCGSVTRQIIHPVFGVFHCCDACELIAKDERFFVSQEEELTIYNRHNNSFEDPVYVEFFNVFLENAVLKYVNDGKMGLDFGSGPEPVLAQMLERFHDYKMDIYDLYYAPEKVYLGKQYDLITATEVVEHLSDPIPYFRLFAGLMKENSILAVMTLFHKKDEDYFKNWHYMRDKSHVSFYTAKTFEYIAKEVGLTIIDTNDIRYITFKKSVQQKDQ